jgi:predicted dehydrogenase
VAGTEGTARWDWGTGRAVLARPGEDDEGVVVCEELGPTYRAELEDFLDAVRAGRPSRTTLAEGAAAVELAEGIKRSARLGGRVDLV